MGDFGGSLTIRSKRSASDYRELLAGIDVLEDCFIEAREMPVSFLQHRLDAIWLHLEHHF